MNNTHIRDWEIERYLLGELNNERQEYIHNLLATDCELQKRLADIEADNVAVLAKHPGTTFAAAINNRLQQKSEYLPKTKRSNLSKLLFLAPALAGAAVILFVWQPMNTDEVIIHNNTVTKVDPGNRVKGAPHLIIHRQENNEQFELINGDTAKAGDLLQLAYVPSDSTYGMIISMDGSGNVTLHFPENSTGNTALTKGGAALPHSYELDDAPLFERFIFITAKHPIPVGAILARAHALARNPQKASSASLELTKEFNETSLLIRKLP
ncbi:MAG: hypothetical protein JW841_13415 [Deltaproteobacteria bacterium]|nr:hypothetical protein [Deltaproteobacteria bacterium]